MGTGIGTDTGTGISNGTHIGTGTGTGIDIGTGTGNSIADCGMRMRTHAPKMGRCLQDHCKKLHRNGADGNKHTTTMGTVVALKGGPSCQTKQRRGQC